MEQLHARDCHRDVTAQATEYDSPKVRTHAQHGNSESGYSSEKQSSRYVTHSLYGCAAHWQHIVCYVRLVGYDVAYTEMPVTWTDEALSPYLPTCASAFPE